MAMKSRGTEGASAVGDHGPAVAASSNPGSFDRILVAVDGETDDGVTATAVSVAARHDAQVDALSIVRMTASVDHWDLTVERREDGAEAALDTVDSVAADADVTVTKRLRYGDPADEIVRYATHNDVDLIVVGEPDRTGLRRYLSPTSVTERVHRSATVPVLTVPVDD